jgi:hypothetical protein
LPGRPVLILPSSPITKMFLPIVKVWLSVIINVDLPTRPKSVQPSSEMMLVYSFSARINICSTVVVISTPKKRLCCKVENVLLNCQQSSFGGSS